MNKFLKHQLTLILAAVFSIPLSYGELKIQDHYLTASTLWHQTSGEFRALSYQAYQMAKFQLDHQLSKPYKGKKRALVVDIDDTLLSGAPYEAMLIKNKKAYPHKWLDFVNSGKGLALPGSLEFLKYADSKGIKIFYITNRKERARKGTLANLKKVGFPHPDTENLFMRTTDKSKEARRNHVKKTHHIVMLIGDSLGDFDKVFDAKQMADRNKSVDLNKSNFGTKFIILPNAMYGDWEGSIYKYNYKQDLVKARNTALKPY